MFSPSSSSPSLGSSPRGCWVCPPPGPHRSAVLCVIGPRRPGAGFAVEGRQVLGRQLPGQREQGVSEVVAMGTWMLTKAREAVSSHSALLRSPRLVSQAASLFALSSTGRRVAPSSGSRAGAPQSWSFNPKTRLPAQYQDGHHHLHPLHGRVSALRGTGKVSCALGSPGGHRVGGGVPDSGRGCAPAHLGHSCVHRRRPAAWVGGAQSQACACLWYTDVPS